MPTGDLKHRARRANEGLKLGATFLNSVAIVTVAAAFITPVANRRYNVFDDGGWLLLVIAAASHLAGQIVLRALRAEE